MMNLKRAGTSEYTRTRTQGKGVRHGRTLAFQLYFIEIYIAAQHLRGMRIVTSSYDMCIDISLE